jgi:hypothetical protein
MNWLGAALLALATASSAQSISGLRVEPAQVNAGEPVQATVELDIFSGVNCGVRLDWDDGKTDDVNLLKANSIPLVISHTYPQPGTYAVTVQPLSIAGKPRCGGRRQTVSLVVGAPPAAPPLAAAALPLQVAGDPPCPAGWKMTRSGVNKRTQTFTCFAPAQTAVPTPKLVCAQGLRYFENNQRNLLGCRR